MVKELRWVNDIIDKGFLVDGSQAHTGLDSATDAMIFNGHAVEIGFGGEFNGVLICGRDQEFLIGHRWVKARDLLGKKVGYNTRVLSVKDIGVKTLYDYTIAGTHSFKVFIKGLELIAHNAPSVSGYGGGFSSSMWFKYIPYKAVNNVVIYKSKQRKKDKVDIDQSILVQLGGTFEKIGEEDEAIGGGSQKMGTDV